MTLKEPTKGLTKSKNSYTIPVIEFEGDLALEFTDELLEALDLSVGDSLDFTKVTKDRFIMKKVSK